MTNNLHKCTEPAERNFTKLEERIMEINQPDNEALKNFQNLFTKLAKDKEPVLIIATGGSKVVAYFLKSILEKRQVITEVIEPRDYFYKPNTQYFKKSIIISASGKTNGLNSIINKRKPELGYENYFICQKTQEKENTTVISWGQNISFQEKSFISLSTSLGPMALILTAEENEKGNTEINQLIKTLLKQAEEKIAKIKVDFSHSKILSILSGYDTEVEEAILESNLTESGCIAPVIHDKGSFCHGRSNLLLLDPKSPIIYLQHEEKELDKILRNILQEEHPNICTLDTFDLNENQLWKTYYLSLQAYYLSLKIAKAKQMDLTMPEYNPKLIKTLYPYKGEM